MDRDMENIQVFVPKFRIDECLAEIRECLEKGWTGMGYKTIEFEEAWSEYSGLPTSHFLNSATVGLHLAVKLLKEKYRWSDGDEIITTPLTFVSTNHAILYENLKPIFADVDEYLCLDPEAVKKLITHRTRAIMFVGLGGNVGRFSDIVDICKENNLKLILDAAHMSGTKYKGSHIGKEADVSIFSFQAVKNLPTADSGMICFLEKELDQEARKWTWLGITKDTFSRTSGEGNYKWYYDVEHVGYKYHGNSIMAALGLVSLKYLEEDNNHRRYLANLYNQLFQNVDEINIVPIHKDCIPSRHLYQVLVHNRDKIMTKLNSNGIFPGVHYRENTKYRMYSYAQGTCPNASRASDMAISLPLHLNLEEKDVERIGNVLINAVK